MPTQEARYNGKLIAARTCKGIFTCVVAAVHTQETVDGWVRAQKHEALRRQSILEGDTTLHRNVKAMKLEMIRHELYLLNNTKPGDVLRVMAWAKSDENAQKTKLPRSMTLAGFVRDVVQVVSVG